MIKKIIVENHKKETLDLELSNPEPSGLYVKSVEGLGPGKATINVNEIITSDGGVFSSSRVSSRNIILTLGMMFHPTIEDARMITYQYFPLKKPVKLTFVTDYRSLFIEGYVEANEPDIFSEDETAQISIICPNPWFYTGGGVKYAFSGVEDMFEFPLINESLHTNEINFGNIRQGTVISMEYNGDVDTGILMIIHFREIMNTIVIYNVDTNQSMTLDLTKIEPITGGKLTIHDEIEISTFTGGKYIYLLREGKYYNIAGCLGKNPEWFKISKGVNQFAFTAEGYEDRVTIEFQYKDVYSGV